MIDYLPELCVMVFVCSPKLMCVVTQQLYVCHSWEFIWVNSEQECEPSKRFCSPIIIKDRTVVGIRGDSSDIDNVLLPETVLHVGPNSFRSCFRLTSVIFPTKLRTIGDGAFSDCDHLISVSMPETVIHVGDEAFSRCFSLISITLPAGLVKVGIRIFHQCKGLTSVTLPEGVTQIGHNAFSYCHSLVSIVFPKKLKRIGDGCFQHCVSLTSVKLPETVIHLGHNAFAHCSSLKCITLPDGLRHVGISSLSHCNQLSFISFRPPMSRAFFIVWAVGNSRHRDNWQLTSVKEVRNVLRLIVNFGNWSRDVSSVMTLMKL